MTNKQKGGIFMGNLQGTKFLDTFHKIGTLKWRKGL